uniref:DUF4005 domain-containing protein n=1 Tax=Kalanchoe fedtschenkoi TaxID=63787 RepID=A0A7N0TF52_KALFE
MGRKGSWFAAIKKVFSSKEKPDNDFSDNKSAKATNLGRQRLREGSSYIPPFWQPSSIEKILGEFEREHHKVEQPPQKSYVPSGATATSLKIGTPRAASAKASSSRINPRSISLPKASSQPIFHSKAGTRYRAEPTLAYRHASATRIQAAYRGYMARRSFRALKGLVRLQGVVRGRNVQRQTMNAMKQMQLMVRVQTQIQTRRIQLLENQALHRHNQYKNDNGVDSTFSNIWSMASESGNADWEDSIHTKEEMGARMQKKMEGAIKRERATAYAYSRKLMKKSSQDAAFMDHRLPWWWNWLERRLPSTQPRETPALKMNNHPTPSTSILLQRKSPQPQSRNFKQQTFEFDAYEALTPRSTKSSFMIRRWKTPTRALSQTPTPGRVSPNRASSGRQTTKYPKRELPFEAPLKDDDSLNSCPPFSAPSYMTPTASAKAKVRAGCGSTPTQTADTPPSRPSSFPLGQGIGYFKGKIFSKNKDAKQDNSEKKDEVGNLSVDSTTSVSAPAGVGRKPFNRFV